MEAFPSRIRIAPVGHFVMQWVQPTQRTVLADIEVDRISLLLQDEGPGIPDIGQAMQEGFSTASAAVREMGFGAGMGLPNMKKNVDELTIESKVGEGTVVRMLTYFSANDR